LTLLQEYARALWHKAYYQASGGKTPYPVIAANMGAAWELISDEVTETSSGIYGRGVGDEDTGSVGIAPMNIK
jgi:hypothetical protein